MNAGTHLGESQSRLRRVEVFDLAHGVKDGLAVFESEALQFEYRKNLFLEPSSVVLSADWEITSGDPAQTKEMIDSTLARRKATQPLEYPSCGSVFKNPKAAGLEAWQVIDRLALRGHRIGNAQISEKHCNWILNLGEAKAQDVRALIDLVKSRAKSELGIEMEEEVRMVGIHHRQ